MTDSTPAIQTRGLTKDYGHGTVLRAVDLELSGGELVALMGANGAGKTTLLGCLAAIVRPTAGEVRWFGRLAGATPAGRRELGMVAHESRLYPQLTLQENLVFAGRLYGVARPAERARQMLAEVGLTAHADRLPGEVSRGMRQRAAMARALQHDPPILLLDEPFTGLDAAGVDWLGDVLRRLRRLGRAICFTTHNASQAVQFADRSWRLQAGRLEESWGVLAESGAVRERWVRAA